MNDFLRIAGEIASAWKVVKARARFFRDDFDSPTFPFDLDGDTGLHLTGIRALRSSRAAGEVFDILVIPLAWRDDVFFFVLARDFDTEREDAVFDVDGA